MDLQTANIPVEGAKKVSLPLACMKFFGKRTMPNGKEQTTLEFANELRALTEVDKEELILLFENIGYEITK